MLGGHGLALTFSPSWELAQAIGIQFLGLFNASNNGLPTNYVLAIELDTVKSTDVNNIDKLTRTRRATTYTDVFAFGVFMLEVACGRRPIELQGLTEEVILVDWVFECWRKGSILDASDPRLEGNYVVEKIELVLKLGLLCSHSSPVARPRMR
ncbi:hypothetical protein CMV_017784 [Castanea mollissima]|uniref:Legume lectin domain-containing protein n=1 Tax=Castanea mollissima TaxID=60419 RepID=A0A8J4VQ76_9ROSI|nr:hypothetical protein CMV_017784 [Castanea mollissima]